ncbi:hypothetical protein EIN_390410 [Entamoeba invadens IP1]|uniref:aspartyl aminopeptidase n=2 Tax=Entamoeba invadens TaxID=33085 RepID=A0A0A1UB52_ENTIV|nr:hypothetical protein EIN_390410 [Entamoeba invadens IP1]ELP89426.1 hypothetical protein EIN_390410 [Entamoeba invadens IP1]BAN42333.1 hypothetical protein, conserved [Entamoeba invadens]|eukprot:XP_004256197.1 hypothetical protein EIN_390410 [Entamoeba invadens IP1]
MSSSGFIDFLNHASGSQFAACAYTKSVLVESGYTELHESELWNLEPQKKYFLVRGNSAIVAFHTNKSTSTSRMIISGSHLDSPYLKLKPNADLTSVGLVGVACETYGGGIWNTWFDRDLGVSGRVVLKNGEQRIFTVKQPILDIPALCVHLDKDKKYLVDTEKDLHAYLKSSDKKESATKYILEKICDDLNVPKDSIESYDICLCDSQPATMLANKFIVGQGIDNLNGVYTSLMAFFNSEKENLEKEQLDVFVAFDNEEVGSVTRTGAESNFLEKILHRVHFSLFKNCTTESYDISCAKSIALSVDGAHANHPNIDKSEKNHKVTLNGGPVLKNHCGQRYMSDAFLRLLIQKAAVDVKTQTFVLRQDLAGGSTIGPHVSACTGITTIDLGNPMLSMHSIREICGAQDVEAMTALIEKCYTNFPCLENF